MYAVVVSGGKQHRVRAGELIRVEKIDGEVGGRVEFDQVLLIGGDEPKIGTPTVAGAKVSAEIVAQGLSKKVLVFHRRRRKGYRKLRGHRQPYTDLKINAIEVG